MAVYTSVTDEELARFASAYPIGEVSFFAGIAEGVENSNYLIRATGGTFILTLYEKRVHERDLPFFLGLMEHLAARGFPCPTPIRDHDGIALKRLNGRPAALVSFMDGMWPRRIDPRHCREVGAAMAMMHETATDFPLTRENDLSVAGWRPLLEASSARADEIEPGLARFLDAQLAAIERAWPEGLPRGVIHADLFPDNAFFLGPKLSGVIDFYFACTDILAYDLAVALNAWCFEADGSLNVTKARGLIGAYRAARPLSAGEIAALPVLARGAALRFLLTRLYDWLNQSPGALVRPKDPREYLRRLRFHAGISGPGDYGIEA